MLSVVYILVTIEQIMLNFVMINVVMTSVVLLVVVAPYISIKCIIYSLSIILGQCYKTFYDSD
jgi:hypothetical protein